MKLTDEQKMMCSHQSSSSNTFFDRTRVFEKMENDWRQADEQATMNDARQTEEQERKENPVFGRVNHRRN